MKFYVIGDITVDHLYHLDHLPAAGEEMAPTRAIMQPGGSGGTISVTLARLGHSVTLAARVGQDPFADFALSAIRSSGVLQTAVQRDAEALTSTITVMQTPDGKRAMISYGAANRQLDPSKLKKKDIDTANALVLSAYSLIDGPQRDYALKAIELAQKSKVPVFLDLGTGAVNAVGMGLLDTAVSVEYLLLNQHELLALTGTHSISAALATLGARGTKRVVVKVGAMGSIVWTADETELVDAVRVSEEIIDSTGAGDSFVAAFAHAVLSGKSMAQAAKIGNAAGVLSATTLGAQSRSFTAAELETLA